MSLPPPVGTRTTITVMGTSDLHGHVCNWDYYTDAEYDDAQHDDVGLAKVATLVARVREARGRTRTLLLDSGDTIQGTPLAYFFAAVEPITQTTAVHPMAAAMNVLGYAAVTVGNHEYNYGTGILEAWARQLDAPVLAANAIDVATGEPVFTPWVLVRVGAPAVSVGILGLTNPGIAVWDRDTVAGRQRFEDLVDTARRHVPAMKAAGADLVVVTAHAGDSGLSSYAADLPIENAAGLVARQVADVDAVLFGHAHQDVPERFVTNEPTGRQVLLAEPACWGTRLTVMDFELEATTSGWRVSSSRSTNLSTAGVAEDPDVLAAVAEAHAATKAYVNRPIAVSVQELSGARSRLEDTAIVDYVAQVQADTVRAALAGTPHAALPVVAVAAPFSRTSRFPAGQLRIKDVAGLYPFDNTLQAVLLTGGQLRDYLEFSARYFRTLAPGAPLDEDELTDNGRPDYNYDILSGVGYDIDVARPEGQRVTRLVRADASPVVDSDTFVVAVNNYRRTGGGDFPHIVTAPVVYDQQREVRQLLIDHAAAVGTIDPRDFARPSWRLVRDGVPLFAPDLTRCLP